MVKTKSQFKLDVAAQKQQGIFKNTCNSLTGASAASASAIHHATVVPPNMPMARPRMHVSTRKSKSKYAPGVFKNHLRSVALGRTKYKKKGGGRKKGPKKHYVRHHKHKAGTEKRKGAAYCTRPYRKVITYMPRVVHRSLKLCKGPFNHVHAIVRLRLFRYKQLRGKTLFLIAQHKTVRVDHSAPDPICRIPCLEIQGKYYNRPYCYLMCRRSTLKSMRKKVVQF